MVGATEEIKEADPKIGNNRLNVKEAEVEPEQTALEATYANIDGDNSRESIKGDVVEVEVSGQSFVILRSITSLEQILKVDGQAKGQIDEEAEIEVSILDGETDGMIFGSCEADKQVSEELEKESSDGSYYGAKASQEIDDQTSPTQMRRLILMKSPCIMELRQKEHVLKS